MFLLGGSVRHQGESKSWEIETFSFSLITSGKINIVNSIYKTVLRSTYNVYKSPHAPPGHVNLGTTGLFSVDSLYAK